MTKCKECGKVFIKNSGSQLFCSKKCQGFSYHKKKCFVCGKYCLGFKCMECTMKKGSNVTRRSQRLRLKEKIYGTD